MAEAIPSGFVLANTENFGHKTEQFRQAGAGQLQVIFDFDRTLTISRPGANDEVTTWHILSAHLPQAGQDRHRELFEYNRALEVSGQMDSDHAVAWWSEILDLFAAHHIDMTEVEKNFLSKASIRPGTKELFDFCAARNIPTVILSAGIKDVIELWAQSYDIAPSIILSNSLVTDEHNRVIGWDEQTLVHVLNKKEIGHPELTRIRAKRPNAIIVGDSLNDADMAEGTDTVIRIRLDDPCADEQASAAARAQSLRVFDAVIENSRLDPVLKLLRSIVRASFEIT